MSDNKNQHDPYSEEAQMNARMVSEWYDRVATGVEKCPFCDLKEKYIISEAGDVVLTMNLFPYIDGHLMVIPRRHIEKFVDMSNEEWGATKELIDQGMRVLRDEMGYQDMNVLYREGSKKSGSSVKHFHFHILPITPEFMLYEKTSFRWVFQKIKYPPKELASKLRKSISKLK